MYKCQQEQHCSTHGYCLLKYAAESSELQNHALHQFTLYSLTDSGEKKLQ